LKAAKKFGPTNFKGAKNFQKLQIFKQRFEIIGICDKKHLTLIFLGRVNIARALQNSSYQIPSFLKASFEANEFLLCMTEPDFEISPRAGAISVVTY